MPKLYYNGKHGGNLFPTLLCYIYTDTRLRSLYRGVRNFREDFGSKDRERFQVASPRFFYTSRTAQRPQPDGESLRRRSCGSGNWHRIYSHPSPKIPRGPGTSAPGSGLWGPCSAGCSELSYYSHQPGSRAWSSGASGQWLGLSRACQ